MTRELLLDPGFELGYGGGPYGDEVPSYYDDNGYSYDHLVWSDGSPASNVFWYANNNARTQPVPEYFYYSTEGALDGTYHISSIQGANWNIWVAPVGPINVGGLHLFGVEPGQVVTWSVWCKVTSLDVVTVVDFMSLGFYKDGPSGVGGFFPEETGGISVQRMHDQYVKYSMSAVAPPDAKYVEAQIGFDYDLGGPTPTGKVYLDRASLTVSGVTRWRITDELAAPGFADGFQGKYSAVCAFNDDGKTPWLGPFLPNQDISPWGWFFEGGQPSELFWKDIISAWHPRRNLDQFEPGGWYIVKSSPSLGKYTVEMKVYSEYPCSIEANFVVWEDNDLYPGTLDLYHTERDNFTETKAVGSKNWQTVRFVYDMPSKFWPGKDYDGPVGDDYKIMIRFRCVSGVADTRVFVDECYIWPNHNSEASGADITTIGVKEWIKDERGMYVGAVLWYKGGGTVTGAE